MNTCVVPVCGGVFVCGVCACVCAHVFDPSVGVLLNMCARL